MIQTVNKNNYGDDMTELNILFQIFNNLSESEKKAFLRKVKGENSTIQSKSGTICKIVPIANPCI